MVSIVADAVMPNGRHNFSPALLVYFFAMGIQTGGQNVSKTTGVNFNPFAPQCGLNWAKMPRGARWTLHTPPAQPTREAVTGALIPNLILSLTPTPPLSPSRPPFAGAHPPRRQIQSHAA